MKTAVSLAYGLLVGFPIGFIAFSEHMPPLAAALAAIPCFLPAAAAAYATLRFLQRRSDRYKQAAAAPDPGREAGG